MGLLGTLSGSAQHGFATSTITMLLSIVGIAGFAALLWSFTFYDSRRKLLPPGPKGLPIIGNMLDLSDADKLPELSREYAKYGPISYTRMGLNDFIWLNTATAVKDLMDKKGAIYSSRPPMPMAFTNVSDGKRQIFMPYNEQWRSLRKITHTVLNKSTSTSYKPIQSFESEQVMYEFLKYCGKDSKAYYDINRRYSASLILTITYGQRVKDWDDPTAKAVYKVLDHFTQMAEPGAWLVDSFPFLARLPSWMVQNWWKIGREWHAEDSTTYLRLYRGLVDKVQKGTAPDCFVKDFYLADPAKDGIDEKSAAYAAGTMVEAGSESTSSAINAWLIACLLYPQVVKKAQEEVDRICGKDRMPTFDDEADMPYIRGMVKEIMRWSPITKIGAAHSTTEDDWYSGYFIPKGSQIILNWWQIHFDKKRWGDDAFDYNPGRYLDDPLSTADCINLGDAEKRDHFNYGAGRRVCAGIHVAQNSMFIIMARTMWGFNVKKATGPDGKTVEVSAKIEPGFLMLPSRQDVILEPRSKHHAMLIEKTWQESKEAGLSYTRGKRGKT